jgi:hypothetical protein
MKALMPPSRPCRALAAALLASALLAGCEDLANSLFDTAAPTGVEASDGEYADEIRVSWSDPSLSSDKWKDDSIAGYDVSWDRGPLPNTAYTTGTSYSIKVDPAYRAQPYSVTVRTVLKSGSQGSAGDTGFALDAETLKWPDGGQVHSIEGVDRWYVTMLAKGFTYTFDFSPGQGTVEFCPYESLDVVHTADAAGSIQAWECDEDGKGSKFFVHVLPSAFPTTVTTGYGPP